MKPNTLFFIVLNCFSWNIVAKEMSYGIANVLEVTSIYDGDTFRANIEGYPAIIGEHMSIRINGIDTPELRGKCDKEKQLARKGKQNNSL